MSDLAAKKCVPCEGGVPPMTRDEANRLLGELKGWGIEKENHLAKTFTFSNFVTALDFVNKIGALAEEQGHHPDICLAWGRVKVETWTHAVNGLTENDFILAAKIDRLAK